jgi:NADH:ubiquinone oxidoreductase subunit 2 (subunit N)
MGTAIDADYKWRAVITVVNSAIPILYHLRAIAPSYHHNHAAPRTVLGN